MATPSALTRQRAIAARACSDEPAAKYVCGFGAAENGAAVSPKNVFVIIRDQPCSGNELGPPRPLLLINHKSFRIHFGHAGIRRSTASSLPAQPGKTLPFWQALRGFLVARSVSK